MIVFRCEMAGAPRLANYSLRGKYLMSTYIYPIVPHQRENPNQTLKRHETFQHNSISCCRYGERMNPAIERSSIDNLGGGTEVRTTAAGTEIRARASTSETCAEYYFCDSSNFNESGYSESQGTDLFLRLFHRWIFPTRHKSAVHSKRDMHMGNSFQCF